jgi:hypothetical protein
MIEYFLKPKPETWYFLFELNEGIRSKCKNVRAKANNVDEGKDRINQ